MPIIDPHLLHKGELTLEVAEALRTKALLRREDIPRLAARLARTRASFAGASCVGRRDHPCSS